MTGLDHDVPRPPTVRLDLTPLVDVIFLLLIFFMVSTTFQENQGIELDLPDATSATESDDDQLRVRLDDEGGVYFQERKLGVDSLEDAARAALERVERQFVVVEADARAEHGAVVAVMDALRRAGAKGLTVATEGGGGSK